MTREDAIYILRNTAFLAPSLEPIDEAIEMACEALRKTENSSEKPNNCEVSEIPTGSETQTETSTNDEKLQ